MGRIWSDGGEDMEWGGCGVMVGRIWSDGGEDMEGRMWRYDHCHDKGPVL